MCTSPLVGKAGSSASIAITFCDNFRFLAFGSFPSCSSTNVRPFSFVFSSSKKTLTPFIRLGDRFGDIIEDVFNMSLPLTQLKIIGKPKYEQKEETKKRECN
jgi:hypothetical protein